MPYNTFQDLGKELKKSLRFRSDPFVVCTSLYCFCTNLEINMFKPTLRKHAHVSIIFRLKLKISLENFDIFLIFAQNIDCGYAIGPPCQGGSNEYHKYILDQK